MAPTTVRVVLVEGGNPDGVTVDQHTIDVAADDGAPTVSVPDRVVSAILSARADAAGDGYRVTSTGVTWTDPAEAAALRQVLASRKIENVVLVSAFSVAAVLARALGATTEYSRTALLYIEPDTATSALVDTADGAVADVRQRVLPDDDDEAVAALVELVKGADQMAARPQHLFVVGTGVDIPLILPALRAATTLAVSAPEDPRTALARGAALASATAQLVASSVASVAQTLGKEAGCAHTALLHVESDSAILAVIGTADGSVTDVRQRFLPPDDEAAVAALVELVELVEDADQIPTRPEGVVVVGSGVDVRLILPALQAATTLPMRVPEQQGAPVVTSSTAAEAKPPAPGQSHGPAVLEARNLSKSYGRGTTLTPVLADIELRISRGEFVALVGPSGSGKSTLLSILGLLEPPTTGDVLVNQTRVAQLSRRQLARLRGRTIGYVFQSFNLLAGLSVVENVALAGLLAGESGPAQHDRAMALLDWFGLAGLAKRVPAELSGGQQQRAAIARALFMNPDVVLADEPTGNLDTTNGHNVIDALYHLNSAGQTIVLVTHDRSIADAAPRLVSLLDGRIESDTARAPSQAAWRASH